MWRTVLVVGCLGMPWGASFARAATDCMDSCAVLKSDAARLACFDQELERRKTPAPGRVCAAPALATAPVPVPAPSPATATLLAPAPLPATRAVTRERPSHEKSINAQVVAIADESAGKVTITLDNGEVWEEVESREGFRVLLHHGVTLTAGLFGSYLLTTDDHRTARVRRIR